MTRKNKRKKGGAKPATAATIARILREETRREMSEQEPPELELSEATSRKETVTPAKAAKWLRKIGKNRTVHVPTVEKYASAMLRNEWPYLGDPIRFDTNGNMMDGQHRCEAAVMSGCSFEANIVKGLDPDHILELDAQRPRTVASNLLIGGYKYTVELPGTVRCILALRELVVNQPLGPVSKKHLTSRQITEFVAEHKEGLYKAIRTVKNCDGIAFMRPLPVYAAAAFLFNEANPELAHEFITKLGDGTGLTKDSPVYSLRRALLKDVTRDGGKKSWNAAWKVLATVKAWNCFLSGKPMRVTKVNEKEKWPGIRVKVSKAA